MVGMGDRVCVDTCSLLSEDEGLLVGSAAQGLFLVLSEAAQSGYVASRPFRVNAGPVHSYCLCPGGKTRSMPPARPGRAHRLHDQVEPPKTQTRRRVHRLVPSGATRKGRGGAADGRDGDGAGGRGAAACREPRPRRAMSVALVLVATAARLGDVTRAQAASAASSRRSVPVTPHMVSAPPACAACAACAAAARPPAATRSRRPRPGRGYAT